MSAVDFVILAVVFSLVALALFKIIKNRKKGAACSGCSTCNYKCPHKQ